MIRQITMDLNDITNIGEDIISSVNNSIQSGDFSHLSSDIGDITKRFSSKITDEVKGTPNQHAYGAPVHQYGQTSYSYDNQRSYENQQNRTVNQQGGISQNNAGYAQNMQAGTQQNCAGYAQNMHVHQNYAGCAQNRAGQNYSVYASDYKNHNPSTFNMSRTHHGTGVAEIVCGILGTTIFGIMFATTMISSIFVTGSIALIAGAVATGSFLVCSIVSIFRGSGFTAISSEAKEMARLIGARTSVQIDELARRTGLSHDQIVKKLKKLISKGIIPQGKFDENQTTLMLTDSMYKQYQDAENARNKSDNEKTKRENEQKKSYASLTPDVRSIIDEGNRYIKQIREYNDRIPDNEIMSTKLYKLEDIMKRIFVQVEKKPSSADELHKFMGYYLPTTTKLIKAYIDVNEQPIEGQNINETKHQIEDTLDVINQAFEKLLDSMFEDMNWDIRSDINVMKTMMAQDGLTDNKDFGAQKWQ